MKTFSMSSNAAGFLLYFAPVARVLSCNGIGLGELNSRVALDLFKYRVEGGLIVSRIYQLSRVPVGIDIVNLSRRLSFGFYFACQRGNPTYPTIRCVASAATKARTNSPLERS